MEILDARTFFLAISPASNLRSIGANELTVKSTRQSFAECKLKDKKWKRREKVTFEIEIEKEYLVLQKH